MRYEYHSFTIGRGTFLEHLPGTDYLLSLQHKAGIAAKFAIYNTKDLKKVYMSPEIKGSNIFMFFTGN